MILPTRSNTSPRVSPTQNSRHLSDPSVVKRPSLLTSSSSNSHIRKPSKASYNWNGEINPTTSLPTTMGETPGRINNSGTRLFRLICLGAFLTGIVVFLAANLGLNASQVSNVAHLLPLSRVDAGTDEQQEARIVHDEMLQEQMRMQADGEPVSLACHSTGDIHLLGTIEVGSKLDVSCPPGCVEKDDGRGMPVHVWGSGIYLDASSVCLAGLHNLGVDGGTFTVWITDGPSFYPAVEHHGVQSLLYTPRRTGDIAAYTRGFTMSARTSWKNEKKMAAAKAELDRNEKAEEITKKREHEEHIKEQLHRHRRHDDGERSDPLKLRSELHEMISRSQPSLVYSMWSALTRGAAQDVQESLELEFTNIDKDMDGQLSFGEFQQGWPAKDTDHLVYYLIDRNEDSSVDFNELLYAFGRFKGQVNKILGNLDQDGDGMVSNYELKWFQIDTKLREDCSKFLARFMEGTKKAAIDKKMHKSPTSDEKSDSH